MPITEGFSSRHSCVGPPKESFTEKRKKQKVAAYHAVLKFNPYRDEEGNYTTKERDAGGRGMAAGVKAKDTMRIENLVKAGPKALQRAATMAKSITTFDKAHRRANAAQAAGQPEMAKIFRDRAKALGAAAITGARRASVAAGGAPVQPATTVKPAEAVHTGGGRPQQAQAAGATVPKAAVPKPPKPNPVRDKIKALYGGFGDRTKPAPKPSVAQQTGSTSGFKKGGPRASAADIAADKTKWTPGLSFAEHKAQQNKAVMKTMEGGPGKSSGAKKTLEGGPGKTTGETVNVGGQMSPARQKQKENSLAYQEARRAETAARKQKNKAALVEGMHKALGNVTPAIQKIRDEKAKEHHAGIMASEKQKQVVDAIKHLLKGGKVTIGGKTYG